MVTPRVSRKLITWLLLGSWLVVGPFVILIALPVGDANVSFWPHVGRPLLAAGLAGALFFLSPLPFWYRGAAFGVYTLFVGLTLDTIVVYLACYVGHDCL
jgi:hypothetical protein